MSYDVSFKAKLEGADQWVYVGDDWINHTSNTAAMIKEVCGSYPSEWNGKRCADMYHVLMQGASRLCLHPKRYLCCRYSVLHRGQRCVHCCLHHGVRVRHHLLHHGLM